MIRNWLAVARGGSFARKLYPVSSVVDVDANILIARNTRMLTSMTKDADVTLPRSVEWPRDTMYTDYCVTDALRALASLPEARFDASVAAFPKVDTTVHFIDDALRLAFGGSSTINVSALEPFLNAVQVHNTTICTTEQWKALTEYIIPRAMYRFESIAFLTRAAEGIANRAKDSSETLAVVSAVNSGKSIGELLTPPHRERELRLLKATFMAAENLLKAIHFALCVKENPSVDGCFLHKDLELLFDVHALTQRVFDSAAFREAVGSVEVAPLKHNVGVLTEVRASRDIERWLHEFPQVEHRRTRVLQPLLTAVNQLAVDAPWDNAVTRRESAMEIDTWLFELASRF